jgi:3,4-dihydroxy 2-butanone 4-phosphate synthase / GTP cyclohydrolase II
MIRHTSGIICLPIVGERLDELDLPHDGPGQHRHRHTAFTVSIDASERDDHRDLGRRSHPHHPGGARPATRPEDLARPGHIFPLRYEPGGC